MGLSSALDLDLDLHPQNRVNGFAWPDAKVVGWARILPVWRRPVHTGIPEPPPTHNSYRSSR